MWKRERMMVDVISLQRTPLDVDSQASHNTLVIHTMADAPLLQNRQCYPFQGIRDDANNFYAGNAYNVNGNLASTKKRPLPATETNILKKQKQELQVETNYTFTSKPYDVKDNLMCYY